MFWLLGVSVCVRAQECYSWCPLTIAIILSGYTFIHTINLELELAVNTSTSGFAFIHLF